MRSKQFLLFLSAVLAFGLPALAQKKVVILGSSSAAGAGATPSDSSWARRLYFLFNKNITDGVDTVFDNRAFPGYVTYQVMPDDFVTPPNRSGWPADPIRNVSYALNLVVKPDVIIISLPSNDVNLFNPNNGAQDYDKKETMDNLRLMKQRINAAGIRCFISTMQPRNDLPIEKRTLLRELTDSILNNFGEFAVNFWDDLVTNDGQFLIQDDRRADQIHPNTLGHRLLFDRISAKALFGSGILPLSLTNFGAQLQQHAVQLKWQTHSEDPGSRFEIQRSSNGINFQPLHQLDAQGSRQNAAYAWTDAQPLKGKSFYRLRIVEPAKTSFSPVVMVINKERVAISKLYLTNTELHVRVDSRLSQAAHISVTAISGATVLKKDVTINNAGNDIVIPIGSLVPGEYILTLAAADGSSAQQRFVKLQ